MPDLRLFPNLQVIRPLGFASKALHYIALLTFFGDLSPLRPAEQGELRMMAFRFSQLRRVRPLP